MSVVKLPNVIFYICRSFSTTRCCNGKRNFRKFILYNRGTRNEKERQLTNPDPELPPYKDGVRDVGYMDGNQFVTVPEKIPELMVPDLTDFKLKPYVSYRVPDVIQSEFTPKDLFDAIYSRKIVEDFQAGKLDDKGDSIEPSIEEQMTPEQAKLKARQTGSDIFCPRSVRQEDELYLKP